MKYLAITQETANWLFNYPELVAAVHDCIAGEQFNQLRSADATVGPLRFSGTSDGRLIALWNVDYLSGTGEEDWGFIKIDKDVGIMSRPSISREVFERCLYVIDFRLRGLMIDSTYFHRAYPNGAHTCLAGRGDQARQYSIGYLESDFRVDNHSLKSVACLGPDKDFDCLVTAAANQKRDLNQFVLSSNELVAAREKRPLLDESSFAGLRAGLRNVFGASTTLELGVNIPTEAPADINTVYKTLDWTYDDWIRNGSSLSPTQRRILESDAVLKHPIRIIGPGGSGKSLLMQLLAIRRLRAAEAIGQPVRVLYVVHNAAMARSMQQRFEALGASGYLGDNSPQSLRVCTLGEYGRQEIQLNDAAIIDSDAHQTKLFQLGQVRDALTRTLKQHLKEVQKSTLLSQVARDSNLADVFARLLMAEISTAIKGHGFVNDAQKYIQSERHLSRLHGLLSQEERAIVFDIFRQYHRAVFEEFQVLDSDDIALSLLGRLRTPIWELKRRTQGYDFVFVDETQLFNENERRLFPLLSKGITTHVPIVLALDEAQEIYGQTTAGLGALGIRAITSESLPFNHRSTKSIVRLAFFVIQRTTDLFGSDFPDFTGAVNAMEPDAHPLAAKPSIEQPGESGEISKFVLKKIRGLRKENIRQIAVICHSDIYWEKLTKTLGEADNVNLQILLQRGDRLPPGDPLVVLSRPAYVGGQEFDAVIAVGLEQGMVPPRVTDNAALSATVEQQALREMYLSFTRARFRLLVVIGSGTAPTSVLQDARKNDLIV